MNPPPAPADRLARRRLHAVSGLTDRFAYPLRASHCVELVNPLWATHAMQARVEKVWDETKDDRTLTLRPGQHHTRTCTTSCARVKVGDHLPDAQPVLPLFITAGSSITPAMSMLRSLIAQERLVDTVHIHYAPHEFDVIVGKELQQLGRDHPRYQLHPVHTHEYGEPKQTKGYFNEAQLNRLYPDWREREAYACGPQPLLAALEKHWEQAGLSRHLHVERFRAAYAAIPVDAIGGRVRFAKSQLDAQADHQTPLLRVAEIAGMNPPHGCRMGICHTCNATLLSGCVRDLRTGKLPNEAGSTVQTCVCATAYGLLRMSAAQRWKPFYLGQPIYALLFEWGIAIQELKLGRLFSGRMTLDQLRRTGQNMRRQIMKDHVQWPLLAVVLALPFAFAGSGPSLWTVFLGVLGANAVANLLRNLWTSMIIFCGHFPADVHVFTKQQVENETRAHWYVRQMLGSCNIKGGRLFDILSGNLSHPIEHHLFPDLPSNRSPELAPRVRALADRYNLPYNQGSLSRQFGTTVLKIFRPSLPGGFARGARA